MRGLDEKAACDNVLLEYRLALELAAHSDAYDRPHVVMLPIFVGERTNEISAALEPLPRLRGGTPRGSGSLGNTPRASPRVAEDGVASARGGGPSYGVNYEPDRTRRIRIAGEFLTEFDMGGVLEMLPEKPVLSVDAEVEKHLERLWLKSHSEVGGRPPSVTKGQTVKQTVLCLLEYQVSHSPPDCRRSVWFTSRPANALCPHLSSCPP